MNEQGSRSIWMSSDADGRSALDEDLSVDVCVIGAGISGLSVAYHLVNEGRTVAVLDDGPVAMGETARTTAHLSNAFDDRYYEMERIHGAAAARQIAASHTIAIDRIEQIVRDERIDCDFKRVDGYLFLSAGGEREELRRELQAAQRAGLSAVEYLDRVPVDFHDFGPCLRFPQQAQIDPLKYIAGVAGAVERKGGRIHTQTHVARVQGDAQRAVVVTSAGRVVRSQALVVATNSPINDWVVIHTKQAAYRSYAIAMRVPAGAVPEALYWDTWRSTQDGSQSYHYVRLLRGARGSNGNATASVQTDDVLIVGGEDHKTGQADDAGRRYARLEAWARHRFPMAGDVLHRWSGQVMEPVDGLAFIGRNPGGPQNVYICTGDSGMGMTHGTIAGMLICDLILGRGNTWADIYDPARKSLGSALNFAKENVNTAAQYMDWIRTGDVASEAEIRPGHGAVIRSGLHLIAAYRDEDGALHECSAVCPHLGGIVSWNDEEKSWDCPCHGSRFDAHGVVLNGPANSDLAPVGTREHVEARR